VSFIAPGFAAFAVLFAVPIVIHLIGRSRAKVKRFAAIDLLLRSERRVARRTRLRQLLLLSVRALAIAAVPLILARPFFEAESDLPGVVSGSQSAVIIVDDSMSMSLKLDGRTLLDRALERARRIVGALGPDADCAIVLGSRSGGAPIAELTPDRARLARALDAVRPSDRATDLTGALKRAAQILHTASRPERRVYLISDLAAHGFDRDPPWAAGAGLELVTVDVSGGAALENRAVTELRVEPAPHLGPRGVRISVDVANFSARAAKEVPVTLRVDGKPVAKGLVDLEPGQKATKRFFHTWSRLGSCAEGPAPEGVKGDARAGCDDEGAEVGTHDVEAQLEPDALPDDDRRFVRVEVRRDLRVLVVDGDPRTVRRDDEVFYLETALRPGDRDDSQLDVTTVTADELVRRRLADYDVVFLCNVKNVDGAALREYVEAGGGLFVSLGSNVDPDAYNQELGDLLPQPLQAIRSVGAGATDGSGRDEGESQRSGDGEHLGRVERSHPALQPLAAGARGAEPFKEARFYRYALFRPQANASQERQVLLRFESGSPALVEGRAGRGRVPVLASTVDRDWNDLPIQPIFLPLVQQATRYLARAPMHEPEPTALVGQRHELPLAAGDVRVEVTPPSGKARVFERDRVAGRRSLGFGDTDEPGLYRVAAAGADGALRARPQASFVVNVDPAESDLARIAPDRLAQLSVGAGGKSVAAPRRRVELWHAMGAGLLLLLLGEALLLRRK
jgi:Aerotolerance regulator N-terminal/von Willebrand factor type A domain